MAAVAITAGSRRDLILGSLRAVKEDLTSVDDDDTWTPGLALIEHVDFAPTTVAATTQWGATVSNTNRQGVVTFQVESGTLEGSAIAYGY